MRTFTVRLSNAMLGGGCLHTEIVRRPSTPLRNELSCQLFRTLGWQWISANTELPMQPIDLENGPNGLNWQCCLAGSSKTVPDYSFEVNSIKNWVPAFFKHKNSSATTVPLINTSKYPSRCLWTISTGKTLLGHRANHRTRRCENTPLCGCIISIAICHRHILQYGINGRIVLLTFGPLIHFWT